MRAAVAITLTATAVALACSASPGQAELSGTSGGGSDTSGSGAGSGSGGSAGATGSVFVPDPDVPDVPYCDVWEPDCPDGMKCVPNEVLDRYTCVPLVPDPKGMYDPCTLDPDNGYDDCDEAMRCWHGTCHGLCLGSVSSPHCADACADCRIGPSTLSMVCVPPCDPFVPCPGGDLCAQHPDTGDFVCVLPVGNAQDGEPCDHWAGCEVGLHCAPAARVPGCTGMSCCAPLCALSDPQGDAQCPRRGPGRHLSALAMADHPHGEVR